MLVGINPPTEADVERVKTRWRQEPLKRTVPLNLCEDFRKPQDASISSNLDFRRFWGLFVRLLADRA